MSRPPQYVWAHDGNNDCMHTNRHPHTFIVSSIQAHYCVNELPTVGTAWMETDDLYHARGVPAPVFRRPAAAAARGGGSQSSASTTAKAPGTSSSSR